MVAHLQASETFAYVERLDNDLKKETRRRIEAEDMLMLRENIFSVYSHKYEAKFRWAKTKEFLLVTLSCANPG